MSSCVRGPSVNSPTAQAVPPVVATPCSELSSPAFRLGTTFQAEPFQCSISVRLFEPELYAPTAQTSFVDTAATPPSEELSEPTLGLGTFFHRVPFQWSASVS